MSLVHTILKELVPDAVMLNRYYTYCFTPNTVNAYTELAQLTGRDRNEFIGTGCGTTSRVLEFLLNTTLNPSPKLTTKCFVTIEGCPGHRFLYADGHIYHSFVGVYPLTVNTFKKSSLKTSLAQLLSSDQETRDNAFFKITGVEDTVGEDVKVIYEDVVSWNPVGIIDKVLNLHYCVQVSLTGARNKPFLLDPDHKKVLEGYV